VSAIGAGALAGSDAPLADVVAAKLGERWRDVLAVIALFSTANTMLLMLVAASRMTYGMADTGALPRRIGLVHPRTRTPVRTIAGGLVVAVAFAASGDLGLVASASNFAAFAGFGAIHLALIALRLREPDLDRPFRIPWAVRGVPVVSVIALLAVAGLIANLELDALALGAGLLALGVVLALVFGRVRR
jgi:APA family basic amino acid/polyamine antiporter